ncbi:hypothetical protein GGI21_004067, partial [Coemansia aciculifera]
MNARVRPKHKPAGKPATANASMPTTPAILEAVETLPGHEAIATPPPQSEKVFQKTPQRTPQKPKQGPKDSPKKKGGAPRLDKADSASDRPASPTMPALGNVDRKPVTKVCIRWLPTDLPEHVFWRSVEPALPWFDAQNVGSVVQKERVVLRELCVHPETLGASAETNLDEGAETEGDSKDAAPVPSSLGATITATVDVYESPNLDRLDKEPYWRKFVPGKQHQSKAKPADPSRAYILFETPAEVDHFYRHYHGHVFSKSGAVSRAAVELAAFQHVPWSVGAIVDDVRAGTIDEDPHFIAFLAMDIAGGAAPAAAEGEAAATAAEGGVKPLSHVSYAAAASANA